MLWIFTAIFILISALPALAKNHVVLIGGGGEPAGETTIFDFQLPRIGQYLKKSPDQHLSISFNGGHSTTENLLNDIFPGTNSSNFTPTNYEALISQYERDIRSGKIRSGEKILLLINSHGGEASGNQLTHEISTTGEAKNLGNLEGSQTVSLDRLERLSRLAEEKGIKLGIVDFSCHSGASLNLANSNTCVISASGQNSFAYGGNSETTFASQFTGRMTPGKNLEQVFLESRNASSDLGFPMISTTEGFRVQNRIYPVLRNYINMHYTEVYDKLAPDIANSVRDVTCFQEREEVIELVKLSQHLERINDSIELVDFRRALRAYSDYRRSVQRDLVLAGGTLHNGRKEICLRPGVCVSFSYQDILSADPDRVITYNQNVLPKVRDRESRESLQEAIIFNRNLKIAKQELLLKYPALNRSENFIQNYPNIAQRTSELAAQVAIESRKLYSGMYSRFRGGPNPCRNFTL